jgi:hypothetical protein
MRWVATMAALVLGASCAAAPAPRSSAADASGRRQGTCTDISGYLDDPSPSGRAVHARPSSSSRILGRIAPPERDESGGNGIAAGFDILAGRGGWLLVEGAGDDPVLTGKPARAMYSGRGWIRGEGVRVGLQASQAFARPSHSSALVVEAPGHGLDAMAGIVACDGAWVLARWSTDPPPSLRYRRSAIVPGGPHMVEGWATGICNIQETSCDGLSGDRPGSGPSSSPR